MTQAKERPLPAKVEPELGAALDVYRRLDTIRAVLAPDLSDQELQLFAMVAERSRLDPFARQIYAVKRKGRVTFQTGIDGFRSSAEETGEYRGSDEPEFGPLVEQPYPHPEWARVVVHRQFANGEWLHQPATAYFDEYNPGPPDDFMWRKMPRGQLAKCAEAAAFRRAFPRRFGDVYTSEEMAQADAAEAARPVAPTARERIAERRRELEEHDEQAEAEAPRDPLVDRLMAAIAPLRDAPGADQPATAEQKKALRETLAAIEPAVLADLLAAAFELAQDADGKVKLTQAEAQALLEVSGADPELFIVEAAARRPAR